MDFHYEAKEPNGKTINGTQAAGNEAELVEWLRAKGWAPINITQSREITFGATGAAQNKKDASKKGDFLSLAPRIKNKDKLVFFRQLATMIAAGIPVGASLSVLIDQTSNKRFKAILKKVNDRVNAGTTLGAALAEHPKCFDKIAIPLVKSGEESGTLDASLAKLAGFMEAQEDLHKKIVSAMTYPAVVITIALLVLGIMVAVVIPQFEKAFRNLNVQMPALTMLTFKFGRWMQTNWYYIPVTILIVAVALARLRKMKQLREPIDAFLIKIPIFGDLIYKAALTRSFRTMGSLLKSGVPVLQALEMTSEVAGNERIKQSFIIMRNGAAMGSSLNLIVREKKLFPPMIGHMIAVGEETGRTDEMLDKIADWYDSELSEKVKRLSSILEPVMVVFVGIIVGFMVLAIFLPIISAIQAFM